MNKTLTTLVPRSAVLLFLAACAQWPALPAHAQGDVFSSGGSPGYYGGGNTTRRTGRQAMQDDSVYCQQTPDGRVIPQPYGGTRRNIPCGLPGGMRAPMPPPPPPPPAPVRTTPVFNYYYINGINTPHDDPKGRAAWRGNYEWDWNLIRGNLVDLGPRVPAGERPPSSSLPPIRVANEQDRMDEETYNFSGTQRSTFCSDAANGRLAPNGLGDAGQYFIADLLCAGDRFRGGAYTGTLAPGDLVESFYQSLYNNLARAALQPDVEKMAKVLLRRFAVERRASSAAPQKQFFVLIVHSQGNFFGEGLAYRLAHYEGEAGRTLYTQRLAIMSFASPTSYESLDADFLRRRLRHFTRSDDAILALASNPLGGAKRPFPGNLPSLWPWDANDLARGKILFEPRATLPFFGSPLLDLMNLGPPPGCQPAQLAECDAGLYAPRMNSHLLENYLIDPPLSRPGKPIDPTIARKLRTSGRSPSVPADAFVLANARNGLAQLKRSLLGLSR